MAEKALDLVTKKEAATFLKVHQNTITNLITRKELKAYRIGRSIRINREDLIGLLTPFKGGEYSVWN